MRPRNWRKYHLLEGKRCAECAESDWRILTFHHKDPSTKSFIIERALDAPRKYSAAQLMAEIDKCLVLCYNCHALEHTNLPRYPE